MLTLGQARELKSIADQYGTDTFGNSYMECVCGIAARREQGLLDSEPRLLLSAEQIWAVECRAAGLWGQLRHIPGQPVVEHGLFGAAYLAEIRRLGPEIYASLCRYIANLEEHEAKGGTEAEAAVEMAQAEELVEV